jgi:hypothetical protein
MSLRLTGGVSTALVIHWIDVPVPPPPIKCFGSVFVTPLQMLAISPPPLVLNVRDGEAKIAVSNHMTY